MTDITRYGRSARVQQMIVRARPS